MLKKNRDWFCSGVGFSKKQHAAIYLSAISLLRGRNGRALSTPDFGGTLKRGLFYAMLCYAMLCVPNVTFWPLNVTFMTLDFSESCSIRALFCKELTPNDYLAKPLARDTCRRASVKIYLHRAGCICGARCIYSSSTGNLYSELEWG